MKHIVEGFQLSLQQERLWRLRESGNSSQAHCLLQIKGQVNPLLLEQAVNALLTRHEIFRTTFQRLPGMKLPVQVIEEKPLYSWRVRSQAGDQRNMLKELLQEEYVFDLEHGPLCYCTFLLLNEQTYLLHLCFPGFLADTQTLMLCAREVAHHYLHLQQSQAEEITQYLQFSEWQNALLEDEENAAERTFWKQQYTRADAAFTLPFEQQPGEAVSASTLYTLTLSAREHIAPFLAREQCSPSAFLLACWSVLLWRFTGKSKIVTGLETDGRIYEELAQTAGPLARYLPFALMLAEQDVFQDVLREVQRRYTDFLERQACFTYEDLASQGGEPLYDSCLQYLVYPADVTDGLTTFSLQYCS